MERPWALLLAGILLLQSGFIFLSADGRIEGYVGSVMCLLGGVIGLVVGLRSRKHVVTRESVEPRQERCDE